MATNFRNGFAIAQSLRFRQDVVRLPRPIAPKELPTCSCALLSACDGGLEKEAILSAAAPQREAHAENSAIPPASRSRQVACIWDNVAFRGTIEIAWGTRSERGERPCVHGAVPWIMLRRDLDQDRRQNDHEHASRTGDRTAEGLYSALSVLNQTITRPTSREELHAECCGFFAVRFRAIARLVGPCHPIEVRIATMP